MPINLRGKQTEPSFSQVKTFINKLKYKRNLFINIYSILHINANKENLYCYSAEIVMEK
jgi:hypothetical protein